jgi:hypothetical protein
MGEPEKRQTEKQHNAEEKNFPDSPIPFFSDSPFPRFLPSTPVADHTQRVRPRLYS